MTASYEARAACPVPSRADCVRALAETSARLQEERRDAGGQEADGSTSGAA